MKDNNNLDLDKAAEIRIKYKIRKMILSGKIDIPVKDAMKLVGPDTAYHLYSSYKDNKK